MFFTAEKMSWQSWTYPLYGQRLHLARPRAQLNERVEKTKRCSFNFNAVHSTFTNFLKKSVFHWISPVIFRNLFFSVQRKNSCFKGSVERSLLPSSIFLIFTRNRPWKSEDHLCTLFFIDNVKGKTRKKRRNTASFVASLGTGVQQKC